MKFFYFKHKLFFAVMESRIYWKVQACMYERRKVQKLKGEGTAVLDSLSLGLGHKCSAVHLPPPRPFRRPWLRSKTYRLTMNYDIKIHLQNCVWYFSTLMEV